MSTTYIATEGDRKVIIRHRRQGDEYNIQYFLRNPDGTWEYLSCSDHFTSAWEEAIGTANRWIKAPAERLEEFNKSIKIAEELRDFAKAIAEKKPSYFDGDPYWTAFEHGLTDIREKHKYLDEAIGATEEDNDFWYNNDEEFWSDVIQYLKDRR